MDQTQRDQQARAEDIKKQQLLGQQRKQQQEAHEAMVLEKKKEALNEEDVALKEEIDQLVEKACSQQYVEVLTYC